MKLEVKMQQAQQQVGYWWNGQPYPVTLRLLPDDQVDILRWKVIVHRAGGRRIPGIVRGAGLHKHYNTLYYIVETDHGILRSKTLTPISPPEEPIPDFELDEDICGKQAIGPP